MPSTIVDSGPLYALFDGDDRYHGAAVAFLRRHQSTLITNIAVLSEVCYLLGRIHGARRDFLKWAETALSIDEQLVPDLARIRHLLDKYADLPAEFADASLVALAERIDVDVVASVDSDFTVYRKLGRRPFRNVFFEG